LSLTSDTDPCLLSAIRLSDAIRHGELSCVEVMRSYLDRISRLNPALNAIISLRPEKACLAEAAAADQALADGDYQGWLHGMPFAVKDLSHVAGMPTTCGSRLFPDHIAGADDPHIAAIRAAGAIFIGKTNTPEWGLGGQTYNALFGATRNALNPDWTAGGSSGGAAAAVAGGLLPVADGSDMMGSLRTPAAFNGIFGFRPSHGRVPGVHADDDLSVLGPMARSVDDLIRLFLTMAADDASGLEPLPEAHEFQPRQAQAPRLGWMADLGRHLPVEPGLLDVSLQALRDQAQIAPCCPEFDLGRLWQAWLALRARVFFGDRRIYARDKNKRRMGEAWRWEIEQGFSVDETMLAAAEQTRRLWQEALASLFDTFDFLVLPATQVFPFSADVAYPDAVAGRPRDSYHHWLEVSIGATLAGLPTVSLPAGFNQQGQPVGIQVMGPRGQDRALLEWALGWECPSAQRPLAI
jgi:amidase